MKMTSLNWLWLWILPPSGETDNSYSDAVAWADKFDANDLPPEHDDLLLEHARQRFDLAQKSLQSIESKSDRFAKFAATLAAALIGAIQILDLSMNGWLGFALALLIASMVVAMLAQRPVLKATIPSIKSVADVFYVDRPKIMLVRSLHLSVVKMQSAGDWMSSHLYVAYALLTVALICLVFGVWC